VSFTGSVADAQPLIAMSEAPLDIVSPLGVAVAMSNGFRAASVKARSGQLGLSHR